MNHETIILNRRRRRRRQLIRFLIFIVLITTTNVVFFYCLFRQFLHFDLKHDVKYIRELMFYDKRIFNILRLNTRVFKFLIWWTKKNTSLKSSRKNMTIKKQLSIFFFIVEQKTKYRLIVEIWVHSLNIIAYVFHKILATLFKLHTIFVLSFTNDTFHSDQWRSNKKFWFYFKNCVDALNDTHIYAHVLENQQTSYRNRKNQFFQNVLTINNFFMRFIYILTNWENLTNDALILKNVQFKNFDVFSNKYYLTNADYSNAKLTLTS